MQPSSCPHVRSPNFAPDQMTVFQIVRAAACWGGGDQRGYALTASFLGTAGAKQPDAFLAANCPCRLAGLPRARRTVLVFRVSTGR